MGKQKYNEEFKMKIVGLYQRGVRQCNLMREFGLAKSLIRAWRKQYPDPIDLGIEGELTEIQKEVIVLRERNQQLEKENEIYRKAIVLVEKKKK